MLINEQLAANTKNTVYSACVEGYEAKDESQRISTENSQSVRAGPLGGN